MKILVIGRPDGIFEYDQSKALAALGNQVTYMAVDLRSVRRKRKHGITHGTKDGIEWHCISVPIGAVPIMLRARIGASALKILYRRVFQNGDHPDVLHAHFTMYGYMAGRLAQQENIPLVMTEHNSNVTKREVPASLLKCAGKAYPQCDRIIAVGKKLAKSILENTGNHCEVIPNMIDVEVFSSVSPEKHKHFTYTTIANLIPRKRIGLLLQAFVPIAKERDARLIVIGDGQLRQSLEAQVDSLGIRRQVEFVGRLNRGEMLPYLSQADAFVLPSENETFGVVYAEAMAAGLPVIATRCGGPEDFVNEENGILVDVDDAEQLESAMRDVMATYARYDREAIKRYAKQLFSAENVGEKIQQVMWEAISGHSVG